ncbi:hypothetical protein DEU31_3282 [Brachybacterium sp. AG952]|nr:hypothetical protein DEU31_3282 [Brachybacterium sp. AG952]
MRRHGTREYWGGAVAEPAEQEGVAGLHPQRRAVGGGGAVAAEPHCHPELLPAQGVHRPVADHHVGARALGGGDARAAEPRDLGFAGVDEVGEPGALLRPAHSLEVLDGAAAVHLGAVVVLVVVLDDGRRGQAPVLDGAGHGSAGGDEPHPHLAGGAHLRVDEARSGVDVEVVGAGGAAAHQQLDHRDIGGDLDVVDVQLRPHRVQGGQPVEQGPVDRRGVGAGEVLVHVVVGVDEPRGDQAPAGVDPLGRLGRRLIGRADGGDPPAGERDPAAGQLAPAVHDQVRGVDQGVARGVGHEGSPGGRVVGGRPTGSCGAGAARDDACRGAAGADPLSAGARPRPRADAPPPAPGREGR